MHVSKGKWSLTSKCAEEVGGLENHLSCAESGAKRTGLHLQSGNSGLGVGGGEGTCMRHKGITSTSRDSQLVSATRRCGILSFCDSPSLNQLHGDRWTPGSLLLLLKLAYLITTSFHHPRFIVGALQNYPSPANNFRPCLKCHLLSGHCEQEQ